MDDFEVEDFVLMRFDDDLHQPWPLEGMACDVPGCQTQVFTSFRAYIKHWKKVHVQFMNVFTCDICSTTFNRRCALNRHYRFVHKFNGINLANKTSNIVVQNVHNNSFIPPGDIYPRKKV